MAEKSTPSFSDDRLNCKSYSRSRNSCPGCGSEDIRVFHELKSIPVQSVLLIPTNDKALNFQKGDVALGFCYACGFVFNTAFDPGLLEYATTYESTQAFSPTFNVFSERLARRLIDQYDLRQKTVLEIGCGNGEFLALLCDLGDNRGIGFDPAYEEGRLEGEVEGSITFIKDFYSEKYREYEADFICCRMTLEHIQDTGNFVSMVRRMIRDKAECLVFFQAPDATRIFRDCAFEDIYYEHCSYFTPGSLARLFRECNFDVLDLKTDFDGQYLMIEARPALGESFSALPREDDLEAMKKYVQDFPEKFRTKLAAWKRRLESTYNNGQSTVLWGSGSKAVAFLTTLGVHNQIEYVVDINPHRHGTYMAGTGQEIVAPDFLREHQPDVVIIMNAVYQEEITKGLYQLGLSPEILTL